MTAKTNPELKMRVTIELTLVKLTETQLHMNAKFVPYLLKVFATYYMPTIMI